MTWLAKRTADRGLEGSECLVIIIHCVDAIILSALIGSASLRHVEERDSAYAIALFRVRELLASSRGVLLLNSYGLRRRIECQICRRHLSRQLQLPGTRLRPRVITERGCLLDTLFS